MRAEDPYRCETGKSFGKLDDFTDGQSEHIGDVHGCQTTGLFGVQRLGGVLFIK